MRQQQPFRLARYNRAVVFDLIRRLGPVSKAELAERSGLAVSSVLNVLSSLAKQDLIHNVKIGPSTGGRPPVLVELNPTVHYALGINIRISVVEAVLVDLAGTIVADTTLPLQGGMEPESVIDTIVEAVDQVLRLGQVDSGRILGAGIGFPGPVQSGRTVVAAPGRPIWRHVPLAERLEAKLGVSVTVDNDANLAALAEYRHGIGQALPSSETLVYVYVDHGIGEGIVLDGAIYRGCDGLAAELGHVVIDVDGPQCHCGSYGCLEACASIESIIRRIATAAKLGESTSVHEKSGRDWDSVSVAAICDAVESGDPVAIGAVDQALAYLAVGVTNVSRQLRPAVVVVGGELFERLPQAEDHFRAALQSRASFFAADATPIKMGTLGSRAASLGAATLVLERFFGVPQQVMKSEAVSQILEPAFEDAIVLPVLAENTVLFAGSDIHLQWAGNLQPIFSRVADGSSIAVTVEVLAHSPADGQGVKALLHWDRVPVFGGSWPSPKNSPMQLVEVNGNRLTYRITLGALPPGKYEFAAHILGANDLWARVEGPGERNGRLEILSGRQITSRRNQRNDDSPLRSSVPAVSAGASS